MKIRIKIVSIITSVIMLFLMVDNVFAETLGETGESATDIYKPCHTNANGCVAITG